MEKETLRHAEWGKKSYAFYLQPRFLTKGFNYEIDEPITGGGRSGACL